MACAARDKKAAAQEQPGQKMDRFLSGLVEKNGFSGAVLVMQNDKEILKKGYGFADRESRIPYTSKTISTIGSVTKQFTGAAILKLEMMGKLSVTATLDQFFPGLPADKQKITLHQLLTHTAGLPPAIGDDYEPLTRDQFIERVKNTPLNSRPGERYDYSNVGYSILAAIVELKSGMNYEQFLQQYFFAPAGMKHTGYVIPTWNKDELATGYRGKERWGKSTEKTWAPDGPYWNLKGNGGILSNVEEMYLWHKALLTDQILDSAAKQKYYGRHVKEGPDAETFYGYGWAIFPTRRKTWLVTHNGGNGIFFCDMLRFLDENVVIIYQTNAMQRGLGNIAFDLARMVFDSSFTPEVKPAASVQEFKTLEETPSGKTVKELTDLMKKGEEEPLKKFISEQFAPGFRDAVPLAERLPRLKKIGARMKDLPIEKVTYDGEKTEIFFKTTSGTLIFGVLLSEGKIAGLLLQD
jgi:CubicO group peptidase (beta-lactamase class C family)